jgi:hypothetical protein
MLKLGYIIYFQYITDKFIIMTKKSKIFETIKTSKISEPFTVKDINLNCDNLIKKSHSFPSKHCEGNPGNNTVYFKRIKRGKYSLVK